LMLSLTVHDECGKSASKKFCQREYCCQGL